VGENVENVAYLCSPLKTKPFLSMNQYETIFILTPVLSDEQVKEAVGKFEKFLNDRGSKMVHQESWGLRKLAYPIQKKMTGFYHLFEFQADPTVIASFEVEFKRDERVLRFLTVRLDKHAIAFNQSHRVKKGAAEAVNEGGEA
jgi:small subunit ribosomal protein S6